MSTLNRDYERFAKEAKEICKDRVYTDHLRRYAYGVDASCYSYLPKVVVKAEDEREVRRLIRLCQQCGTPFTFRAAGSSLSGQCSSEDVLIVCNDGFKKMEVIDDGKALKCECGVIGSDANDLLKPYNRKIGPDPATLATALVGGILNNNSSGMCCGTAQNSYKTIRSIRVVLLDGTVLDTSDKKSIEQFLREKPQMVEDILQLRKEILADEELTHLIHHKYKIKNTTGYGLNSLVDFEDIIDIINHLFIGSEGTLGFVSEIVYNTVEDVPHKGCGLMFFSTLNDASLAVVALANMGREKVIAAEMMDYQSLRAVQSLENVPEFVREVPEGTSAILFQTESYSKETVDENLAFIKEQLKDIPTAIPSLYSQDPKEYDSWWAIRKGILPIVGGQRRKGTTVITEDVCFQIEDFTKGIEMLTELFHKYDFVDGGVIFGHALSGNVHFNITPDFNDPKDTKNFGDLVKEMSERVSGFGGSLKAEHGTGRMVAPFVEMEWGKKAYELNRRIKAIFDPERILNPDVIITDDPDVYKKNLKAQCVIDDAFTICMECGFCEKHCPSRNLTLTPRQRIALLRETKRLENEGNFTLASELRKGYEYFGVDTCAACSMCKGLCPLSIDTAQIALSMRRIDPPAPELAKKIYDNFSTTLQMCRAGVSLEGIAGSIITQKAISKITEGLHGVTGVTPYVPKTTPKANRYKLKNRIKPTNFEKVVYFSTCANRAFKPNQGYDDDRSLQQVVESLCNKAHIDIIYPQHIENLCCGLSFENYDDVHERAVKDLHDALMKASQNGKYPIVIDHSACFNHAFKHMPDLEINDISEFLCKYVVPHLDIEKCDERVIVHKQCKIKSLNKSQYIEDLARLCTDHVFNIKSFACDGFAGQKGFFTPELNKSATKDLAGEIAEYGATLGVSSSSTCEIGLGENGGIPFVGVAFLLDRCSKAKQ
ncbi:MAG: FAD-binding and (Fe-S)-binding domain-containing protein [Veillonella dispar]|uniref:FAD-binding and (Fe-S)-binding domain-containing protein n=1 Tax=Veillonella dispar TaxID=39778 RepID=UPI00280B5CC5|nr:FAD-binding and (Fe-S)-binding domain-containing protein [Veillonella dispar]MDU4876982.1 FAD-binding and (Fe-S)-binding domain-containing protein [Veillonella dispar]MDU4886456.1 FAD-binding and (Fe-S)-binding domain-containing protein [Veillonella dispar]